MRYWSFCTKFEDMWIYKIAKKADLKLVCSDGGGGCLLIGKKPRSATRKKYFGFLVAYKNKIENPPWWFLLLPCYWTNKDNKTILIAAVKKRLDAICFSRGRQSWQTETIAEEKQNLLALKKWMK